VAFKKFSDHSARWQREKRNAGVTPQKWNAWDKLTPKSKKVTNPTDYGKGETVRDQVRAPLVDAAAQRVVNVMTAAGSRRDNGKPLDVAVAKKNLNHKGAHVSAAQLRKMAKMSSRELGEMIDEANSRHYDSGDRSPFWYNKKG
jgi:hypothetical protein